MRCFHCGSSHAPTTKHFPKQLVRMDKVGDKEHPGTYTIQPVRVGVICAKCVRKDLFIQLRKETRKRLGLAEDAIISREQMQTVLDQLRAEERNNEEKRKHPEVGGDGAEHPELLHNSGQEGSNALPGETPVGPGIHEDGKG